MYVSHLFRSVFGVMHGNAEPVLEEVSTHKSANTHADTVFVHHDLIFDLLTPK